MQASTAQRTGVTAMKSGAKSLRRAITAQEKARAKKAPMVHARLAALRAAIRSLSMSCAEASAILGGTTHLELAELSTTEHIDLQVDPRTSEIISQNRKQGKAPWVAVCKWRGDFHACPTEWTTQSDINPPASPKCRIAIFLRPI